MEAMNRFACGLVGLVGLVVSCGGSQSGNQTSSPQAPVATPTESTMQSATQSATHSGHQSGMQAGEEGKHSDDHSHEFPPALNAFHDTLKPLWHAKGDTRATDACAGVDNLKQKADGVIVAPVPEKASGDTDGWKTAAAGLASSLTNLESQCAKGVQEAGFEDAFKAVHDAFHVLVEKLGDK